MERQQFSLIRRFRFRLRTAMLVLLIACVAGGIIWHRYVKRFQFQAQVVRDLKRAGANVTTEPGGPHWLRALLGDDDCQDIRRIDMGDCNVTKEQIALIAGLPRLQTLIVAGQAVGDEQLLALQANSTLEGVILDSTGASESAVARLRAARPSLLVWESSRRATSRAEACGWLIKSDDVKPTPRFTKLFSSSEKHLKRALSAHFGDGAPDGKPIARLKSLEGLWMLDCREVDAVLREITTLRGLSILNCQQSDVTDQGLSCLVNHQSLTHLFLTHTGVGDAGLQHLGRLGSLEHLKLMATQITDDGMVHLAKLRRLRELILCNTQVTDAGLKHIRNLRTLDKLVVSEGGVTRDAIRRLHKALPGTEMVMFDKSGEQVEFEWTLIKTIEPRDEKPAESALPIPVPPVELRAYPKRGLAPKPG